MPESAINIPKNGTMIIAESSPADRASVGGATVGIVS